MLHNPPPALVFGFLLNVMRLTAEDIWSGFAGGGGPWPLTMFEGHTVLSVLVVFNLAFSGLLVSYVIKCVSLTLCLVCITPPLNIFFKAII